MFSDEYESLHGTIGFGNVRGAVLGPFTQQRIVQGPKHFQTHPVLYKTLYYVIMHTG